MLLRRSLTPLCNLDEEEDGGAREVEGGGGAGAGE